VVVDGAKPPAQTIEEIYQSRDVKPEAMLVEGLDMWSEDAKDMKHVSINLFALYYLAFARWPEKPN
jgi:hypothetical protein